MHGRFLDTIHEIVPSPPVLEGLETFEGALDFAAMMHFVPIISKWMQNVLELCRRYPSYPTGIPIGEAIWRSLVIDGAPFECPAPPEYEEAFHAWETWF
jgi:hypothetical protein